MNNLRKTIFLALLLSSVLFSCAEYNNKKLDISPVDYVNPYMGNISHLLVPTFPTVHLPNSMLRVYPHRDDYTTDNIKGLPIIVPDHRKGGYFTVAPFVSSTEAMFKNGVQFSYEREVIKPYKYSVYLDQEEIAVDFAPSHQSAVYSFSFCKTDATPKLMFNAKNGEVVISGNSVQGSEKLISNGNSPANVYMYGEFDAKVKTVDSQKKGKGNMVIATFDNTSKDMTFRYGVSFISVEQAKKNYKREVANYSVKQVAQVGREIWEEALGKIEVEGASEDEKTVFYTSLYRTYERPVNISEDGRYFSPFDGKIRDDNGRDFLVDDWLWDTFRASHPLRTLIDAGTQGDIVNSYIEMSYYRDGGKTWFPNFPKVTGDSHGMNCNHGVGVVLDSWRKGVRSFDLQKAFTTCRASLEEKTLVPWSGAEAGVLDDFYKENGYFPALHPHQEETVENVVGHEHRQAVAVTLGTSYDHWCLSEIAKELGMDNEAKHYAKTGLNYRNVFNPETRFFHPKDEDGKFIPDVDYRYSRGRGARHYYDENNAYTYRWEVQHNVADLVSLIGGKDMFCRALDSLFNTPLGKSRIEFWSTFGGDQTGNVGQFSMGNEPSFHIPYLYNYAGEPWMTQKRIRQLIKMWFRNDLMGVPGDEDGGGMSAFVVFSQLGFYPVTPGLPIYNITSPIFTHSKVKLSNGKTFEIIAANASEDNKYIQSAKLNGVEWDKPWFTHEDLINGGVLELELGDLPNKNWGATTPPPSGYDN
ncbi:MAG: GH92 family glycosyl hydrolase [Rikenellaceae bacterium]